VVEDKPVIVAGSAQINAFLAKYGLDPQAVSVTATLKLVKQGTAASVTLGAAGTEVAGAQSLERNRPQEPVTRNPVLADL
jgi:hypothetical protein